VWDEEPTQEGPAFDPVRWPHTSTVLHYLDLAAAADGKEQPMLAWAAWRAVDKLECKLMGGC